MDRNRALLIDVFAFRFNINLKNDTTVSKGFPFPVGQLYCQHLIKLIRDKMNRRKDSDKEILVEEDDTDHSPRVSQQLSRIKVSMCTRIADMYCLSRAEGSITVFPSSS